MESLWPTCRPLPGVVSGTMTESFTSRVESGIASDGGCVIDGSFLPPLLLLSLHAAARQSAQETVHTFSYMFV